MKLKKRINHLKKYMYDSKVNLKDRSFVIFSSLFAIELLLVAIPLGFIMNKPLSSALFVLVSALVLILYVSYSISKNKIHRAKIVISIILVFIFIPILFFTNGGIYSGTPISLLLVALYINLILEGRMQIFMNISYSVMVIISWGISYYNPNLVTEFTRKSAYIDSLSGMIIVNAMMYALLSFNAGMYRRENEIAREKSAELEELNRAQNRFFSNMSHEIRTPINTVLGLNEIILRQEDASEEIKNDARNIQGAGKLLLALINDILDVSRIEAGKMDIVPVNYNVASLLSEVVNMIWLKAEEKGLKFEVDIDPDVPETLFGDEIRIKQILINLLNNAVKYTKEGSVCLHMECESANDKEVLLKISVSDTGMGIRREALPHLFDTFKRVDEEKNRFIEGTGLGLSIVKQLVELMGGEISVNSVYSEGSTFVVTLAQGVSSEKCIGNLSITNKGNMPNAGKFTHRFSAPDARILIVDDNEMNLEVEKKLLEGTGITIDLALSGQEALMLTLKKRYDVIFMDHYMPEMDGIECYKRICNKKGGLNSNVPVIVLTANAGGENIELYNNAGFDDYLVKPVSGSQLEEMLLKYLPEEKVVIKDVADILGLSMSVAGMYSKKKAVAIAVGSMADLPKSVQNELQIGVIPSKIITDAGAFYDNVDVDSEEVLGYMSDESRMISSDAPSEEEYIRFFSSELKKAHHLIFITLASGNSNEYRRAKKAAESFENVTIINSELISGATGILAMIAATLAGQNLPVDRIVSEVEEAKKYITCNFVVRNTKVMEMRGRINPILSSFFKTCWISPLIVVKDDRLKVGRIFMGSKEKAYKKYIKRALTKNSIYNRSLALVTYVGLEEEEVLKIEKEIDKIRKFDHIIFQKSSASIATNSGGGTFGIFYMTGSKQKYNPGAIFDRINDVEGYDYDVIEEDTADENAEIHNEHDEFETGKKWYENIDKIDSDAAIKNSGSLDAFKTVVNIFCESVGQKMEEIENYYSSEDWENYTIKVHALKSSAKLVGAMELSEAARKLEMAGNEKDEDYIRANHEAFVKECLDIESRLSDALTGNDNDVTQVSLTPVSDKPVADEMLIQGVYEGIREAANDMDCEMIDAIFAEIDEYVVPDSEMEKLSEIRSCADNFDYDGIFRILDEVD